MIVVTPEQTAPDALETTVAFLAERGISCRQVTSARGLDRLVCDGSDELVRDLREQPFVAGVDTFDRPYGLVSRDIEPADTVVPFGNVRIGGGDLVVIAGPCSVESVEQLGRTAECVAEAGAHGLRGGAFKPRTSPWAFQGLGLHGLELLKRARAATGLPIVTEVMAPEDVEAVAAVSDMLQVGSRNVQNFRLLEAVGASDRPVLLKRGMMSTIDEFLAAAEYVVARGNPHVVLCERGIRSFEPRLRNTLDLGAVVLLKRLTHLPIIVDPSHACGLRELVPQLACAAVAAGADGVMVEVHPHPERALSDGRQSLTPEALAALVPSLARVAGALGRRLAATAEEELQAPVE